MYKELFTLADKIKYLREKFGYTQAELARELKLTRSSVNSWEMGLSIPSTSVIIRLSKMFNVSSDYLLGLDNEMNINVGDLSEKEISVLFNLIDCLKEKKQ